MSRSLISIACALALAVILNTPVAHAQGVPISVDSIELSASTDNPAPGQMVTITAVSYSADINSAKISWSVNGTIKQSAPGATTLSVQAPALGKKLNIVVTAVTTEGRTISGSILVGSGSVDMIMETDGYVPPFFDGKLSPIYQNSVTVIAVPHIADSSGNEYDPKTLVYTWKKNSQALQSQSGYGRQSITLVGDIVPRPYDLTVSASSRDGKANASGRISVTPQSPSILFYVNDPLYGPLFNEAVNGTVRIGSQRESNILAIPYGFNKPANGLGDLAFTWLINNVEHTELASNDSVILRAPEGTAGSSNIQLNIANSKQILQGSNAGFTAMFTAGSANATPSINY